jgi:uncharacterized membrane protein YphA (DoxX/SURF4 family)
MFPSRTAGAALIVFRVSVAVTLVVNGTVPGAQSTPLWVVAVLLLVGALLCLGFLTPYCAVVSCLIELAILLVNHGQSGFSLAIAALDSAVLAVLGPGAYSIDARIFGWRTLTVPPRR